MARMKKKGQAGASKNYITRNDALRKLQIKLPDFRRLCIWKGIYPREPRDRKKVSKSSTHSTTFYYAKDIQYLLHEPLLQNIRDHKALEKKIARALGRNDVAGAKRLKYNAARPEKTGKPRYTLNHLVRERYTTFVDGLRDLDDCLSMLFLFAHLPNTTAVPAKMIARCERLCLEFQHHVIFSHSLKKSFLSIKGIYYQVNIRGEDILWLVPYKFNQRVVGDVDFKIMGTFVEFYMTLLSFVNLKLYRTSGLKYPPKFDKGTDDKAGELSAITLEATAVVVAPPGGEQQKQITDGSQGHGPDAAVQAAVDKVIKEIKGATDEPSAALELARDGGDGGEGEGKDATTIDKCEPAVPGGDVLLQPVSAGDVAATLFANCTFYLSRETPRQALEFILRSFGCRRIGWDSVLGEGAFTTDERDPRITHQVVDRPLTVAASSNGNGEGDDNQTLQKLAPNQRMPGRVYVQPQWVWDSINDEELKHPAAYAPGAQLPPHLSPFVQKAQGQYDPTAPLEEQESEGEALDAASDDENVAPGEGMDVDDDDDDAEVSVDANSEYGGPSDDDEAGPTVVEISDDEAGPTVIVISDDEEDDHHHDHHLSEAQRQTELEAELSGAPIKPAPHVDPKAKAREQMRKDLAKKAKDEAEELLRAKGMMSKKKRKLLEKMEYSSNKKSEEAKRLRAKRRRIESEEAQI